MTYDYPDEDYPDYPFTKWTDYFRALLESFSTENFGDTFPKYEEALNDDDQDDKIMETILEMNPTTEWAQEGLDGLIQTCIEGCRYSCDSIPHFKPIIQTFLKRGAIFNIKSILTPLQTESFEDEASTLAPRGLLLYIFFNIFNSIPDEIKNATPIYWEDMMNEDFKNFELNTEKFTFMEAFYNGIKYVFDDAPEIFYIDNLYS